MSFDEVESFLVEEIFKVDSMFSMYISIHNSASEYHSVMNIASAFFRAATLAFLENSTLRLCKLFDKNTDAITMQKYLLRATSDPLSFSGNRAIINKEANACSRLVESEEPKLIKLRVLRDSFLAHNDSKMLNVDPFIAVGLTIREYRSLITLAGTIVNRIRKACDREHLVFKLVDDDDYKYILTGLSEYVKEHPNFIDKIQKEKALREREIKINAAFEILKSQKS